MHAVLQTGGKQYRVTEGDTIEIERLGTEAGQTHTFDKVLLVSSDEGVKIGRPTVEEATVTADVLEHKRGKKVVAFKMKRRKATRSKKGHRQELTVVKITGIKG